MPLYNLLCVAVHYPQYEHIKQLVTHSATHLLEAGAVVRAIHSQGTRTLPQRINRHGVYHTVGDYWSLHFDAAPRTVRSLNAIMRRDPRVIRCTVLKLADNVPALAQPHAVTVV